MKNSIAIRSSSSINVDTCDSYCDKLTISAITLLVYGIAVDRLTVAHFELGNRPLEMNKSVAIVDA